MQQRRRLTRDPNAPHIQQSYHGLPSHTEGLSDKMKERLVSLPFMVEGVHSHEFKTRYVGG